MDEVFTRWYGLSDKQKSVYAAALGLDVDVLNRQYLHWYAWRLLKFDLGYPLSIDYIADADNTKSKCIIRIVLVAQRYAGAGAGEEYDSYKEMEVVLHADDYDNEYARKIISKFQTCAAVQNVQQKIEDFLAHK